ncbi:MAG TPA: carboxymuconolactone decarboxylase family protein [Pseudonocardiaceae bacterium]|nr:carboxymuconolactone decarboxylase family protein [Pseudonocardiaceae bacterium]
MTDRMDESMAARGDRIRREVLGDEHVDNSNRGASAFSKPVQDLVTEYCWGVAWGDDTLDRRTRSLLNIVMMVALNRRHELELHTKGALRNGVTPEEIQAALVQATVYCGVPAGMEGFRAAASVVDEEA